MRTGGRNPFSTWATRGSGDAAAAKTGARRTPPAGARAMRRFVTGMTSMSRDSRSARILTGRGVRSDPPEVRDDRGVVAGADVGPHRAGGRPARERLARQDVVDAPSDVALAEVAPRRPPREEAVVGRVQRAAEVHQAVGQDPLEDRAFVLALPDGARLALLGMNVLVGPRHVQVPAEQN